MSFDPLMGADESQNAISKGYEPRAVERGACLVSVVQDCPMVIIQLPRGSLESLHPRALILPFVMRLIESEEYGQAFTMMRRHKVDLNLFVDMTPVHFLKRGALEKIINQVCNIDHLNLFIACLSNTDCTKYKFPIPTWFCSHSLEGIDNDKETVAREISTKSFDFNSKVNQVCSKMRPVMMEAQKCGHDSSAETIKSDHFLHPILCTFAKESPPKLEQALDLIKSSANVKDLPVKTTKSPLLSENSQNSLKYLAFLADYKELFNTALGMYDYELAKAVARNSQMDPKIYVPMLKRLSELPEFVAKYEVDLKLERFESALINLFRSGDGNKNASEMELHFQTCLDFVEEHRLHKRGIALFYDKPDYRRKIMISLGEILLEEGKGNLALGIFLAAEPKDFSGAKRAARRCGDWRTYFACLSEQLLDENDGKKMVIVHKEIKATAADIAAEISVGCDMQSRRENFSCASRIYLEYCHDTATAIDMLISAEMWFEGRRIALMHHRNDLAKRVADSAISYGESCLDDFEC